MLLKGELHQPHDYITIINVHVTDGMAVMSVSDSLQYKTSVTIDLLCQIALNQILSRKFKFLRHVEVKLCKKKSCKMRLACIYFNSSEYFNF